MASTSIYINEAQLDSYGNVWCAGRDLMKYTGTQAAYLDSSNSAVPDNGPYYLDTRSISIDADDIKWVGCAVSTSLSQNLIFSISDIDAATGESWNLSNFGDLSSQSDNWEVPEIYASPYCNDILAFISPLNGGSGTGATGTIGVTGGYLWKYNKDIGEWNEMSPDHVWPHIYEITAKCQGDGFDYYLATDDGLQIISNGHLDLQDMADGSKTVQTLKKLNSNNSGIGSNIIYGISFDEYGNYWVGTESGLSYWDGEKFYNWEIGGGLGVTKLISRSNGHIFFRIGDPFASTNTCTGFYHFNGDSFTLYNTVSSDLPSDRIISLLINKYKSNKNGLSIMQNDLWIVSDNDLVLFDYEIPHIYGSSKYTGATGWNFIDYSPTSEGTTGDNANIPKSGKYTWTCPTWTNYDYKEVSRKHPKLDTRNMFLSVDFHDLANGNAGRHEYWNSGEIPEFEDSELNKLIPESSWLNSTTEFTITSTCKYRDMYAVSGYTSAVSISLGDYNSNSSFTLNNTNPTYGSGSTDMGFIAFFSSGGQIRGAIPIRGYDTKALKIKSSLDDSSLFILGSYTGFIEAGSLVYPSEFPGASNMNVTGTTGSTGAPIGFSNIAAPGINGSSDYPWILNGSTGATSGAYIPDPSMITNTSSYFIAEVDFDLGNEISYGNIDFTSVNDFDSKFCLKNFRYFPGASSEYDQNGSVSGISGPTGFGISDMAIGRNSVRVTGNLAGGISTMKNLYNNVYDSKQSPDFIFSTPLEDNTNFYRSGILIDLDSSLNLRSGFTVGLTGGDSSSLNNIESLSDSLSYILTGTSTHNVISNDINMVHPNPGYAFPFFILNGHIDNGLTGAFIGDTSLISTEYTTWNNTSRVFKSDSQYYIDVLYTGEPVIYPMPTDLSVITGSSAGSLNISTISVKPGGYYTVASSYEILSKTYETPYTASLTSGSDCIDGDYYSVIHYTKNPVSEGNGNMILKRNVSGTFIDSFSAFSSGPSGDQDTLKITVSKDLDIFMAGSNYGSTGPDALPFPGGTSSFINLSKSYKILTGKNMGDIISIPGAGAWTWSDVYNSESDMYIPLLSTIFMNNYASPIFGKRNNRWILTNAKTNEVLLDVKNVPYFIYTFVKSGYYSIYNSVEDSAGNVYEETKPAFIKVVDQSVASAGDPNPEYVNSADFGYIETSNNTNSNIFDIQKDLLSQQKAILKENKIAFGSGLTVDGNGDGTFEGN